MSPDDKQELDEIRERVMDTLILVPTILTSQEANDRAALLDLLDDEIQINAGLRNQITTLTAALDQYKANIAHALKELEEDI